MNNYELIKRTEYTYLFLFTCGMPTCTLSNDRLKWVFSWNSFLSFAWRVLFTTSLLVHFQNDVESYLPINYWIDWWPLKYMLDWRTDWPFHQYVPFSRKHLKPRDFCNDPGETATVHEHRSMSKSTTVALAKESGN